MNTRIGFFFCLGYRKLEKVGMHPYYKQNPDKLLNHNLILSQVAFIQGSPALPRTNET